MPIWAIGVVAVCANCRAMLSPTAALNVLTVSLQVTCPPAVVLRVNPHVIRVAKLFFRTVTVMLSVPAPDAVVAVTYRPLKVQAIGIGAPYELLNVLLK